MYLILATAVLACVAGYRYRAGILQLPPTDRRRALLMFGTLCCVLVLQDALRHDFQRPVAQRAPMLVALAVDVSLSMGAMPDPRSHPGVGTRLERARQLLLPVIAELDASEMPVMLSLTAFTARSAVVLGWDDDTGQVLEALTYVLQPDWLTEPGTSIAVALAGVEPLLNALPADWQDAEAGKVLFLVSDGRETVDSVTTDTSLGALRTSGVKIVSVYTASHDADEGLPIYDDDGDFTGFDPVNGQLYAASNEEMMQSLAGEDEATGLFVRTDDGDATRRVEEFLGIGTSSGNTDWLQTIFLLASCLLIFILLDRYA